MLDIGKMNKCWQNLANRGILFIPRATQQDVGVVATMAPVHSNTSLFVGFSGPSTPAL